jgi:hypothetical protein
MDRANFVKTAVDAYFGRVEGNYSVAKTQEALRAALIEMNGGSDKLTRKSFRDHPEMYSIVEEIITITTLDSIPQDNPLFDYMETRNLAYGDSNQFTVDSNQLFIVSQIAEGTQGLRRQRQIGNAPITVATVLRGVKIYEELARVLSGRSDFNKMIANVARSFSAQINIDAYNAVVGTFDGLTAPYKVTGTFDAGKLATLIDHVEAENDATAIILTSKQGARQITGIVGADAHSAKEDLYNMGYFGHFGNNPIITMKNRHVPGTTNFALGNNLYVVASNEKFIKFVTEGETTIISGSVYGNADLSQDYFMGQRYGVAAVLGNKAGVYEL